VILKKNLFPILLLVVFAPLSYAECIINGVIYAEYSIVGEYQCLNGDWVEHSDNENTTKKRDSN